MRKPPRPCSRCGMAAVSRGLCRTHARASEARRGTSTARGYGREHRDRFRAGVLTRDPVCVICQLAPATQADHYPLTRRQLEAQGLDPNDPQHGRGLCHPCHSRHTASTSLAAR